MSMSFHSTERPGRTALGVEYRIKVCAPESRTPPHAHARPLVCLVLRGVSELTAGGVEWNRVPGTAFFYPAGEEHHERFGPAGGRIFSVDLQAEGLRLPERSTELYGLPGLLARRAYIRSAPADELAILDVESAIFALTGELARESSDELRWLPVARDYLRAHFAGKLSLAEIAAVAGIHPVHLSRAFPRRFGMTVGDYVRALRLDYAARELMTTRRPIVDIALDAGFASQAHLTRHFSARMGVAPAAFRASC
jgi:AraC family transcriptional regulator